MVALATPMNEEGGIDYSSLEKLVTFHLDNETDGIVILGTTGESPTISADEHNKMVTQVVAQVAGQIPVISGVGTNNTATTLLNAQMDTKHGVDGLLVVTPYYNKPTQEGLYQHYKKIAQAIDNKIILYNVPGRTGVDLQPETVVELSTLKNIVGIKETVNIARVKALRLILPKAFEIYCGDDENNLPYLEAGAQGLISVTANIAPKLLHDMCKAHEQGNGVEAQAIHNQLMPVHKNLFIESNPIPVKFALAELGLINRGIRLPLTWLAEKHQTAVRDAMKNAKLGGTTCDI